MDITTTITVDDLHPRTSRHFARRPDGLFHVNLGGRRTDRDGLALVGYFTADDCRTIADRFNEAAAELDAADVREDAIARAERRLETALFSGDAA